MAKSTTLSSDVDFIKEFEELKLKQKLLIDSLNKKNISQQNQLFLEINSKLDFLVKIFKEANDADNKEEEEKLSSHFKEISDKMDLMQKSILEKIETQEKSISSLKEDILNLNQKVTAPVEKSIPVPPMPAFEIKSKPQLIPSQIGAIAPITSSSIQGSTSVSATLEAPKEEKKKGWFK